MEKQMKNKRLYFLATVLIVFEIVNFSVTEFALTDLIGPVPMATLLAIVFSLIDLGPVLVTGRSEGLILGIWFIAAVMNASLSWQAFVLFMPELTALLFAAALLIIRLIVIGSFAFGETRPVTS